MRLFGVDVGRRQAPAAGTVGLPAVSWGRFDRELSGDGPIGRLPVVFGCMSLAADRLRSLPRTVRGADDQPVRPPRWLEHPNPWQTGGDLISTAVVALWGDGNWFLVPIRDGRGAVQQVALPHPRDVVWHPGVDGGGHVTIRGSRFDGELVHVRYLAVPGRWRGLGPLDAARTAMNIGMSAQDFVARHFEQGAVLQHAFTTKEVLGRQSKLDIAAQITAQHIGAENAWRPLILDSGLTAETLGMTAEQAQFLELAAWIDAKIAGQIFKVDPSLVGIVQQGASLTYTNALDRERNLWLDALKPLAVRIDAALSLLLPVGQRLRLDERSLLLGGPRDRAMVAERMARLSQLVGEPVFTADELRDTLGYAPLGAEREALTP